MLARCGVEHRLQVRMHGNGQGRAGLFLLYGEHALANVLAAHAQDIAAPLCGVEQQREREARLRADRMMRLKLRDLFLAPRVESVAFDRRELDVCRWIAAQVATGRLERKLAERAQRREPTARRVWR